MKEYKIVVMKVDGSKEDVIKELNDLAAQGFKIISSAGAGAPRGVCWMWSLEKGN